MKRLFLGLILLATVLGGLTLAPNAEARGRKGSHRVGGKNSHGKGSHYRGGRTPSSKSTHPRKHKKHKSRRH